jgi:hypothetical protein
MEAMHDASMYTKVKLVHDRTNRSSHTIEIAEHQPGNSSHVKEWLHRTVAAETLSSSEPLTATSNNFLTSAKLPSSL